MHELKKPNIERLVAAMRGEKTDRVPNFEDIVMEPTVNAVLGKTGCPTNRTLPVEDAIEFARRTGQDAIMRMGDAAARPEDGRQILNWADFECCKEPDIAAFRQGLQHDFDTLEGTGIGLGLNLSGPFFTTYRSVGEIEIQDFMIMLYDDLPLIEAVMDKQVDYSLRRLEAVIDLPIDFFSIADDTCDDNGFMCNPDMMATLWAPRIKKIVDLAKQKGIPVCWHCCGKLDQVIPYLLEWEIDCINPVQTRCNDIFALHEEYHDRLAFRGNVCIEGALSFGTPDEVRAEARELLERLGSKGSYILASSHSIIGSVPLENYMAMIETAWEFEVH
jgi:uroporphyrinogen decarboxylase